MPGADESFLDSNIVLYALGTDTSKRAIAWSLLMNNPCISIQVLNECSNVLNRKRQIAPEQVAELLGDILTFVRVEPVDVATVRSAWRIQARYRYSYYDSLIIATALAAGCTKLFSQDMQHGQIIEGRLAIVDPFSEPS